MELRASSEKSPEQAGFTSLAAAGGQALVGNWRQDGNPLDLKRFIKDMSTGFGVAGASAGVCSAFPAGAGAGSSNLGSACACAGDAGAGAIPQGVGDGPPQGLGAGAGTGTMKTCHAGNGAGRGDPART